MTDLHVIDRRAEGDETLTVVGLPGLSSTAHAWDPLAAALPNARVVATDLRGRGGSAALTGPPGLRGHADDVARLLDEMDLRDVVLVGHSMGAFLAPIVAQKAADRIGRVVLVDGGLPPGLPFFMRPPVVRATFRFGLRRLDRNWDSVDAYLEASVGKAIRHRPDLRHAVAAVVGHELSGTPGKLRPTIDIDRAVADAADTFFGSDVEPALDALTVPTQLLVAAWKMSTKGSPFIADSVIDTWRTRMADLSVRRVQENHLTILFAPALVDVVAG